MAKRFNSGNDRAAGRGRESRDSDKDGKKKKDYKAKRSFTRNKSFRTKKAEEDREEKKLTGGDRPFRRSGFSDKSDKPFRGRPGTSRGGNDRESRSAERESSPRERSGKRQEDEWVERSEGRRVSGRKEDREPGERRQNRAEGEERRSASYSRDNAAKREDRSRSGEEREGGGRKRNDEPRDRGERGTRDRKGAERGRGRDEQGTRRVKHGHFEERSGFADKDKKPARSVPKKKDDGDLIRLNKYLSNAGIASRRDADNLILGGTVKVNGVVVDQLGYKIKPTDKVTYGDAAVKSERKVYLLLNKPKDYITTVEDPRDRKTVMELIQGACRERIYPVGRLDRNTTGLLLFTNDGELTTKLTHPKFGIKKVYHVTLNKGLKPDDFKKIIEGIELEDGMIKADDLAFVGEGKKEVGIEIHSGRNRIVRRLFEHLGYDVLKLDRVVFAGLTKKDLPRGKHRFLTAREISFLQMIG